MKTVKGKPQIYALSKQDKSWRIGRRRFLAGVATAASAITASHSRAHGEELGFSPALDDTTIENCNGAIAHADDVSCAVCGPDQKFIATGSYDKDVKVWEFADGNLRWRLSDHVEEVNKLACSPDGKWLLSGAWDGRLIIWDAGKGKKRKVLELDTTWVADIRVSRSSKKAYVAYKGLNSLAYSRDGSIKIISLPTGKLLDSWKAKNLFIDSMAVGPDEKRLVTSERGDINMYSLETGRVGELLYNVRGAAGSKLVFDPKGRYLVTGLNLGPVTGTKAYIYLYNASNGSKKKAIDLQQSSVGLFEISKDGKVMVVYCGSKGTIKIYSFPKGKIQGWFRVVKDDAHPCSLALSGDGHTLILGYVNGAVRFWNVQTRKLLRCIMDLESNNKNNSGVTYTYRDAGGNWITVTVPNCSCAPRIPETATCVCNVVQGSNPCTAVGCTCVGYQGCSAHGHYWYPN